MLQRYAAFLGGAPHEYIIDESLKRLFRRDKEFIQWLERNHQAPLATSDTPRLANPASKNPPPRASTPCHRQATLCHLGAGGRQL